MWEMMTIIIKSQYTQTLQFLTIDFTRNTFISFFTYTSIFIVLVMIIHEKSESPIYL